MPFLLQEKWFTHALTIIVLPSRLLSLIKQALWKWFKTSDRLESNWRKKSTWNIFDTLNSLMTSDTYWWSTLLCSGTLQVLYYTAKWNKSTVDGTRRFTRTCNRKNLMFSNYNTIHNKQLPPSFDFWQYFILFENHPAKINFKNIGVKQNNFKMNTV